MAHILGYVIVKITPTPREPNGTFNEGCTKR